MICTVLEDDRGFFPIYNLAVTVRRDVLEQYPEIEAILAPLAEIIDDQIAQDLNYQVDAEGLPEEMVAETFLKERGLIE